MLGTRDKILVGTEFEIQLFQPKQKQFYEKKIEIVIQESTI